MKKIEVIHLKPSEIKTNFGNPRTITKKAMDDLKKSIEKLDDFGVFVIDEENNIISGNQRLEAMKQLNIKTPVLCKKLIGYSDAEKKAINIKANTSSGEWDNELYKKWLEDIEVIFDDLNIDMDTLTEEFILPSGDKEPFQQMTFTLADKQAEYIKKMIADIKKINDFKNCETFGNENSNGNALYYLIESAYGKG